MMMRKCQFANDSSAGVVTGGRKAELWGATFCYLRFKEKAGPGFKG